MRHERVAIIGAGVGGLVSAALLAARGVDVTLFEAEPSPGGKLRALKVDGADIDAGPTVFTMRDVFDRIFDDCGSSLDHQLTTTPAAILARHAWQDGSRLDLHADPGASDDAIGSFAGSEAAVGYRRFRGEAKRIFDALDAPFLKRSNTDPLTLGWRMGAAGFRDYCTLRPYTSLWSALGGYFPDPRLQQLFGRYATYCGSSPFQSPATLMLIAHVEASGVWAIDGGMNRLGQALAALATKAGATLRYGHRVDSLSVDKGRATGVVTADGDRFAADRVIVNADPAALGGGRLGAAVRKAAPTVSPRQRSLSALVWLAKGKASGWPLDHHNVCFSNDYRAEFDALRASRVPGRPSVYVCSQADGGHQIIVNAPSNGDTHSYTPEEIDRCRTQMLGTLEHCGLTLSIDAHSVLTPNDFERLNRSTGGALYGRASHGWAASFRRQGSRTRIAGLYCAGGSCHPGAGVPMAALSGRLAAECLLSDLASTARSRRGAIAGGTSMRSAMMGNTG